MKQEDRNDCNLLVSLLFAAPIILCNTRLVFFARTKGSSYIPLSAKKKYTIVMKKVHEQVAKIS